MIPVIVFSGYSNSGKTSFLEQFISFLKEKNIKVSVIKHHKKNFELCGYGKDSSKYYSSGADSIYLFSDSESIIIKKNPVEKSLSEIVENISDVDLILAEGFKCDTIYPKIEMYRKSLNHSHISLSNTVAIISDDDIENKLLIFKRNELENIHKFILNLYF